MHTEPIQPISGFLSSLRMNLRHRKGCYRWTGDGRCVDCRRYTGIPPHAIPRDAGSEVQYYDRRRVADVPGSDVISQRPTATPASDALEDLTKHARLYSSVEACDAPPVVPGAGGVYAWYFRERPGAVPVDGCIERDRATLLYVGIAPTAPRREGRPASRQTLRSHIRNHYRGNAASSTLRMTLGCLLEDRLGIQLRRVGSGKRMTFATGEARLSRWMDANALVCWHQIAEPWSVENQLLRDLVLPLNLEDPHSPFHQELGALRRDARARARALPVIPR